MTEYKDELMEKIASEFIVGTCQLLPKSYDAVSDRINAVKTSGSKTYAMNCGSSAEFYIRPVNTLIDDLDTLIWKANALAFIEDFPVLPNDMSRLDDTIKCLKIEPYRDYPGFVQLRIFGKLNYNWKGKKYAFSYSILKNEYIRLDLDMSSASWSPRRAVTGPSIRRQIGPTDIPTDHVQSVWCPQWPKEAQGWPGRAKHYGWPTIATISEVVRQGCHVVYVQHRACRDDKLQWRFSFSVAEVILLQSWTQIQQIVYHLLRFFATKELIKNDCPKKEEVLCKYHLKTLMLWTCEEMSPEWWNSSSVIVICCELLQKLSQWLKRRHCPNYFIPEANLFHQPSISTTLDKFERRLNECCNSGILCLWFLEIYIQPIFDKVDRTTKIKSNTVDFMLCLIDYREMMISSSLNILFQWQLIFYINQCLDSSKLYRLDSCLDDIHSYRNFRLLTHSTMSVLPVPENVSCFRYFDKTLFSLHAMNGLCCGEMSWNCESFVEYIKGICFKPKTVRCQYHNFPEPSTAGKSHLKFLQAQDFMENLTGLNSPSEFQLLSLVSKELLRNVLDCEDSQSNGFVPAALIYLAALHSASSENQIVIDLCSVVLMAHTTHVENETLNLGCLFFIDDVVRIVGFYLLWKTFRENMHCGNKHIYLDLRLTPNVFAYYLTVKFCGIISKQLHPSLPTSTFSFDQLLSVLTKRNISISIKSSSCLKAVGQCVYRRKDPLISTETLRLTPVKYMEKLVDDLTEYAFENMTLFYSAIRKNFGIQGNTVDCYRALYLYKCRQYNEVLNLCERILQKPGLENDLKEFVFATVLVLPPFDSFFDEDVQSLLGFNTLYCYLSPLKYDLPIGYVIPDCFTRFVFSVKSSFSCSFGMYNPYTCHYFVGRHFLARYLQVRCCIACNYPCTEALAEFAAMKSIFPFEHIIRRFVLRKSGKFRNNSRDL